MKIRLYVPGFQYPPRSGTPHVAWGQARALVQDGHEVEILFWNGHVDSSPVKGVRFTPIDLPSKPAWARYARSWFERRFSAPELFFYPLPAPDLSSLPPVDIAFYHYAFARTWLETWKQEPALGPPETKRVVVFHNLESDLYQLRSDRASGWKQKLFAHQARLLETTETQAALSADEAWFISKPDLDRFKERNPTASVSLRYLPPTLDATLFQSRSVERQKRERQRTHRFGFIGALDFAPNEISVEWILDRLCPELQKTGFQGTIEIMGRSASEKLKQKAKAYPFVKFLGFVDDAEPYWTEWDALLCPNIGGSGTRIKTSEALLSGVPVLSNAENQARTDATLVKHPLLKVSDQTSEWVRWMTP